MRFEPIDSPPGPLDGDGLVPDTILPEQFFRPSAAVPPEKQLLVAVLETALLDFQRSADARTPRARRLADEVDAWFVADDEGWPCAFLRICHALGLDAAAVRTRLARWRADVVTLTISRTDAETPAVDRARRLAAAG